MRQVHDQGNDVLRLVVTCLAIEQVNSVLMLSTAMAKVSDKDDFIDRPVFRVTRRHCA